MQMRRSELPTLEELTPRESDSYIGILKGDLDGLGRLLAELRFEKLAEALRETNHRSSGAPAAAVAAKRFSIALKEAVEGSIHDAFEDVHPPAKRKKGTPWPVMPLIAAGDDLLILSRREVALELAYRIGERFARRIENEVIVEAAKCAEISKLPSISFGVLFAKVGYPFDASFDLAEDLLKSSKRKGRTHVTPSGDIAGFVDYHWLSDSARPDLFSNRKTQEFYRDYDGVALWLTTKPWGISDLDRFIDGARQLRDHLPRRKLKQIDEICGLGKDLGELAFRQWLQRLEAAERDVLRKALVRIRWIGPEALEMPMWQPAHREDEDGFETCLPDLSAMTEMLA